MAGHSKPGRPKGTAGKKGIMSDHEIDLVIKSILNANRSTKYRNAVLILFNHYLGLKAVDLAGLKVLDVFDGKDIFGGLILSKVEPVTVLRFNKEINIALDAYIKCRMQKEGEVFSLNSALFKSQKKIFSAATLARLINTIYKETGFPNVTSHSGKRSFVKNLVTLTQDVNIISKMTRDVEMNARRYLSDKE